MYLAVAIILTWPLVVHLDRAYFSPELPGDGMGTIAENWYALHAGEVGTGSPVTTFYAYPFGYDRTGLGAYPMSHGVMNQLAHLAGAQGAYNLLILFSFPLAGLAMLILLYYLGLRTAASFLGGFLYAFSPWHNSRVFDQASLTNIYVFPLFLLALIVFWKRRDLASALFLAVAGALAAMTDVHFGLFCGLIALAWIVAALYVSRRRAGGPLTDRRPGQSGRKTAALVLMVMLVVIAVTIPMARNVLHKDPAVVGNGEQRDIYQAIALSANPWNYIVPPAHSLLWRDVTDSYITEHLGFRTTNEVTAYPGIVTAVLAVIALVLAWGSRRKKAPVADPTEEEEAVEQPVPDEKERLRGAALAFCVIVIAAAFILSLAPLYNVQGMHISTPSRIIAWLLPFFRYYCRWSVVVTFGLCILAGIGFHGLAGKRKWSGAKAWIICLVLLALFAVDVTIIPPLRAKEITRPPEVFKALAASPGSEPVAIYPLAQTYEYANLYYRYFQGDHRHSMLNGAKAGTEAEQYRQALQDLYSPYTARMLSGLGIKKVVVVTGQFFDGKYGYRPFWNAFDPAAMPPGYKLVTKTDDGYIFDVTAEPAQVYPFFYSGFSGPGRLGGGKSRVVMQLPSATMLLVKRDDKGTATRYSFSIEVSNPGTEGMLVLKLDGKQVGSWTVGEGHEGTIETELDLPGSRHQLVFEWNGAPVLIAGTPFGAGQVMRAYLLCSSPALQEAAAPGGTP